VARQLDDEDVEASGVADRIEDGRADIADRSGAQAAGDEHRGGEARGRRLPVGAGDEHPVRRSSVRTDDLVADAPRQLDVSPERNHRALRPPHERVVRRESRRGDDDVGGERHEVVRNLVERSGPCRDADDRKEARVLLVGALADDQHLGAEFGEGVGDGEAGDREAEDGDAQTRPVRVPAGQPLQTLGAHVRVSHST